MRLSLVSAALTAVALTAVAAERDVSTFSLETQATSFLGVRTADVDAATAKRLGLPVERGVLVLDVEHDGPAHEAGLRTDDVLWRFRDQALHSVAQLRRLVRETPPGRKIEIALYRAGALTRVSIVLAKDESRQEYALDIPGFRFSFPRDFPFDSFTEKNRPRLGISVVPLTGQLAEHFGAQGGLLVTAVDDGSPAETAGIEAGDVIERVDGHTLETVADLRELLEEKAEVSVELVRDRRRHSVKVRLTIHPSGGAVI